MSCILLNITKITSMLMTSNFLPCSGKVLLQASFLGESYLYSRWLHCVRYRRAQTSLSEVLWEVVHGRPFMLAAPNHWVRKCWYWSTHWHDHTVSRQCQRRFRKVKEWISAWCLSQARSWSKLEAQPRFMGCCPEYCLPIWDIHNWSNINITHSLRSASNCARRLGLDIWKPIVS